MFTTLLTLGQVDGEASLFNPERVALHAGDGNRRDAAPFRRGSDGARCSSKPLQARQLLGSGLVRVRRGG